ncbi:hypothetical protein M422DRAFT_44484 [Sphaerobolus stellatus SS14]|nr:hypothetical protein M422DRAFT_44484 [Sphaerobolus stellatus SS14]
MAAERESGCGLANGRRIGTADARGLGRSPLIDLEHPLPASVSTVPSPQNDTMDEDTKPLTHPSPPQPSTSPSDAALAAGDANASSTGGTATGKRYRAAPAKTFACRGYGECRMVFSRSEHLARHVRKHTGERPFQCHCGKQFSRLDNLRQHAQTVHADKQVRDLKNPVLPQRLHLAQDQNERMMRDLTSLHTSMSAGAKRDARKKAAAAQAIGAVPAGLPAHSLHHPSLMQQHSMVTSPIGLPPGYSSPTGPGGMGAHIPGHMHAQSMSAAIGHSQPYHDPNPARYGRGRPGTSAGYEGSGFDPHPSQYDPRRWPQTQQTHAGPPPGQGSPHPSLWHQHPDASAAGFGTSSPTGNPASNTSHPNTNNYTTTEEAGAGFREGGFHRPPVPVAAQVPAPSQTTTSSSSTSQQMHASSHTPDLQQQQLGFRDGSGLGFRQDNNSNNNNNNHHGPAGFGLNTNPHSSNIPGSTPQDMTPAEAGQQGFRDMGGTSSSFRGGSFRGEAGAGGSYGRDAPRSERERERRYQARGDDGDVGMADADAPREPFHGRDEYDGRGESDDAGEDEPEQRDGDDDDDEHEPPPPAGGGYSFLARQPQYGPESYRREQQLERDAPAAGPGVNKPRPRAATPDSPATRDAAQPQPFAESQSGRYEQSRLRGTEGQHERASASGAGVYGGAPHPAQSAAHAAPGYYDHEREQRDDGHGHGHGYGYGGGHGYGPGHAAGYGGGYGHDGRPSYHGPAAAHQPPYGYGHVRDAERAPPRAYDDAGESPPSSTSTTTTAPYPRDRDRRGGTRVLLPDAFAFAGRPGTAPATYAGGGMGVGRAPTTGGRAAEPSSPTGPYDSPFSFHPPGLGSNTPAGYATTTPATSSQSTASAAASLSSLSTSATAAALAGPGVSGATRKRAAPDTDFDSDGRGGGRPNTGRPGTGAGPGSRPQSRRLSVMELLNDEDERPPTSSGAPGTAGGSGTAAGNGLSFALARAQRLLPVSRPGTGGAGGAGDGHLVSFFRRPDTGGGVGGGAGGGAARPGSSSGSPFAFAHPGDRDPPTPQAHTPLQQQQQERTPGAVGAGAQHPGQVHGYFPPLPQPQNPNLGLQPHEQAQVYHPHYQHPQQEQGAHYQPIEPRGSSGLGVGVGEHRGGMELGFNGVQVNGGVNGIGVEVEQMR